MADQVKIKKKQEFRLRNVRIPITNEYGEVDAYWEYSDIGELGYSPASPDYGQFDPVPDETDTPRVTSDTPSAKRVGSKRSVSNTDADATDGEETAEDGCQADLSQTEGVYVRICWGLVRIAGEGLRDDRGLICEVVGGRKGGFGGAIAFGAGGLSVREEVGGLFGQAGVRFHGGGELSGGCVGRIVIGKAAEVDDEEGGKDEGDGGAAKTEG